MNLPNLELLVYKTQDALARDKDFVRDLLKIKESHKAAIVPHFNVICFPQVWGSTCTGFDVTKDGKPVIAGCAMTEEYTTVVHETLTDTYCVFFGDRLCYAVRNAPQSFYDDLKNRDMASLSVSKTRY